MIALWGGSTWRSRGQLPLSRPSVAQVISPQRKVFALKRIRLTGLDTESAQGFVDEIHLLRRLKGKPSIIQLVDAEVWRAISSAALICHDSWRLLCQY